jgi:hypothetical protein
MNKLQRKVIHSLPNGELLIEFPDLNQAVLIGRPNPRMIDSPLTAGVITDFQKLLHHDGRKPIPRSLVQLSS